jgi:hypothetical protein
MSLKPKKELFNLKWTNIRHCFWQSETAQNRTYLMCDNEPIAYQDFKTCNYVFSSRYLDIHTKTKIGISKWVGLAGQAIKDMLHTNQYKIVPDNKFVEELVFIGKTRWKGVITK